MIEQSRHLDSNAIDRLSLDNDRSLEIAGRLMLGMVALTFIGGAVSLHNGLQDREDIANLIEGYSVPNELDQPAVQEEIAAVQADVDNDNKYLRISGIGLLSSLLTAGAMRVKRKDLATQLPDVQGIQYIKRH